MYYYEIFNVKLLDISIFTGFANYHFIKTTNKIGFLLFSRKGI